jgi:hypothetical protein
MPYSGTPIEITQGIILHSSILSPTSSHTGVGSIEPRDLPANQDDRVRSTRLANGLTRNAEMQGLPSRAFTDEQEEEIVQEVIRYHIALGRQFVGATFRELALRKLQSLGKYPPSFQCRNRSIQGFRMHLRFSSGCFHMRCRQ